MCCFNVQYIFWMLEGLKIWFKQQTLLRNWRSYKYFSIFKTEYRYKFGTYSLIWKFPHIISVFPHKGENLALVQLPRSALSLKNNASQKEMRFWYYYYVTQLKAKMEETECSTSTYIFVNAAMLTCKLSLQQPF